MRPRVKMLEELVVSNLGLIRSASVEFSRGLTVVTGETGTGKTLMLGALRLLVGASAPKGMIGPHGDSIDVSCLLVNGDEETTLRRTVGAHRSKAYLDGGLATAGALADATAGRIAIVGQHDQHTITSSAGVRALVDRRLDAKGHKARAAYLALWADHLALLEEAKELGGDLRALEREAEMLEFQISEIDEARFEVGEEASLRGTVARLRSSETLASEATAALNSLGDGGATQYLEAGARSVRRASAIDPTAAEIADRLDRTVEDLSELINELVRYTSELSSDASELDGVEERLALLGTLKRKYGDSIEDILTFHKDASARHENLRHLLESAADIEERIASSMVAVRSAGGTLSKHRTDSASSIAEAATDHLRDLGFSDPVVAIDVADTEPAAHGCDSVTLLFASDRSLNLAPVSSVASGGELSRLVLALTLAAGGAEAAIVAFDEIDAGIGGTTALAMGAKLAALAKERQVICVTHLPQVAAHGSTHLVVARDGTTASVSSVDGELRVEEIARMLAGLGESDTAQQHAVELLERAAEQ
jgi:DNA repair protein RecN (Recombination protein N)